MRILLASLLVLMAIANAVAAMPVFSTPTVPRVYAYGPLFFAACAVIAAILVLRRNKVALLSYTVGLVALFVIYSSLDGALATTRRMALGLIVLGLFFIPSVWKPNRDRTARNE